MSFAKGNNEENPYVETTTEIIPNIPIGEYAITIAVILNMTWETPLSIATTGSL
ncbi:hypothetical protein PSE10B_53710 [Pseudomonas amygdali pv. eriobotryae]|nr:hypothetical protein PSE10B_53710 [Pseudomonas amygdali pv. eriobotryae]GFZ74777.1 hypothetical protein PSE10C_55190 [Pseudomonas amygdali pv. eriobotryae]